MDYKLYLPKEWFSDDFPHCVKLAISLGSWPSPQKTRLLWRCSTAHWGSACFMHSGLAVMRHMGMTMTFIDSLKLPEGVWYFAATNAKEQLFQEYPQITFPNMKKGCPRKLPVLSQQTLKVQTVATDPAIPWGKVILSEGGKSPIITERKFIRCYSCRKAGNRSYVKPGYVIWLYLRRYADGEVKYFVSNAPESLPPEELDRAATLR